ncbi:hypothetical protein Gotur_016718 [Gossypium turneri]
MTWFFILHGVAVAAEVVVKKVVPEKMRLHSVVSGALAMGFLAVTAIWLLLPPLMRNDVDEKAIGEYCKLMDLLKGFLSMCLRSTWSFMFLGLTFWAVFYVPGTNILGGLHTCWTRVWVACGARGPFYELHGCMRTETVTFPGFLQAGSVALHYELGPWLFLRAKSANSPCCSLRGSFRTQSSDGIYPGQGSKTRIPSKAQVSDY